jgi:hypothetical protein
MTVVRARGIVNAAEIKIPPSKLSEQIITTKHQRQSPEMAPNGIFTT